MFLNSVPSLDDRIKVHLSRSESENISLFGWKFPQSKVIWSPFMYRTNVEAMFFQQSLHIFDSITIIWLTTIFQKLKIDILCLNLVIMKICDFHKLYLHSGMCLKIAWKRSTLLACYWLAMTRINEKYWPFQRWKPDPWVKRMNGRTDTFLGCTYLYRCFFLKILKYSGLWPLSVFPRCQCVHTPGR